MSKAGYRNSPINCGLPGEPRAVTIWVPYEHWLALDKKARETNQARGVVLKPMVIEGIERTCGEYLR